MLKKQRDRQGIVPGFSISGMDGGTPLGDVKTMIRGEAYLEKKHQNVPFGPVNARAKRVNHECQKHAKEIDAKYNNTMYTPFLTHSPFNFKARASGHNIARTFDHF